MLRCADFGGSVEGTRKSVRGSWWPLREHLLLAGEKGNWQSVVIKEEDGKHIRF